MKIFDYELSNSTVILLGIVPLVYWYYKRKDERLKKLGLKGPKSYPIVGLVPEMMSTPAPQLQINWYKKYGKLYATYQFDRNDFWVTVGDPDLIKQILVKDFYIFHNRRDFPEHEVISKNLFHARDENWKKIRPLVSPTFTTGKLKKIYQLINDCHKYCLENLEEHIIEKKELDLKDVYGCFTMDVIAKCAFGTETNAKKDVNNPFVVNGKGIFNVKLKQILTITRLIPVFANKLFFGRSGNVFDSKHSDFFINAARHLIRQRRANNEKQNDFLQLLMDSQSDLNEKDELMKNEAQFLNHSEDDIKLEKQIVNTNLGKKTLDENEILGQAWVFFLAGYETTASTLSLCSYELALNQDIQDKLYNEVKAAAKEDGNIEYETLLKLPYLDAVIAETLRKHPPLMILERQVCQDYTIPNTDVKLTKGDLIEIPVYAMHHCEEYYPDPEKFDPDRFLPEKRDEIKPYTYLPFGAGPRNCVGMRFGLLEAKLCLAKIILKYKFVKSENTDVPLKYHAFRIINAAKRVIVGIERR